MATAKARLHLDRIAPMGTLLCDWVETIVGAAHGCELSAFPFDIEQRSLKSVVPGLLQADVDDPIF